MDGRGEKLVATHCVNQGRRYRYYVSASTIKHRRLAQEGDAPQTAAQQRVLALRLSSGMYVMT